MRRAVATATVLLTMCAVPGVAYAVSRGASGGTYQAMTGSWRATPSPDTFTLQSPSAPPEPQYTTVTNNGTLVLVGSTYEIDVAGLSAGTVSLKACSGTWNETAHTCSGTTTTIVTSDTPTASVSTSGLFPAAPNDTVRLQISLDAPAPTDVVVTLSVSAARNQVRTSSVTSS